MTENRMQKVKEMIRKTLKTENQKDCFDVCTLYVDEHCIGVRTACILDLNNRFLELKSVLEDIQMDVKAIKKDIGLNGNS
jgi:hypothetical protein